MPTILIAEDSPEDAAEIARVVGARGWTCEVVSTGDAALAAIRRGGYAAVILDNRMPGLNGVDVLARLCAEHHGRPLPTPPIAMFTVDPDAVRLAVDRGATWFIHKDHAWMLGDFLGALC